MELKRGFFTDTKGDNIFDFLVMDNKEMLSNTIRGMILKLEDAIEFSDLHTIEINFIDSLAIRNVMAAALYHIEHEKSTEITC